MAKHQPRFFLGANTPLGFVSRMDQLCDPQRFSRVLILKGGPGDGKSVLLARVAEALEAAGRSIECIACSFSPDRLDAVACADSAVLDGSAPHHIEPRYPGAVESVVWMGDCWDEAALRARKEEILALTRQKDLLLEQSSRYLAAADALFSDNWRLVLEATDTDKIERQAERIAAKEFSGGAASERVRLLSAMTASGHVLFSDTARLLADRIVLLEDEYGPACSLLLASLRRRALAAGCEVLSCPSPSAPHERIDHLFLPALSLGFVTKSSLLSPEIEPIRVINARRFTDRAALSARKKRLGFNKKASNQMLLQAQALLAEAGRTHRALEAIYTPTVDFDQLDLLTRRIVGRLL
jgi:hypothetical protein